MALTKNAASPSPEGKALAGRRIVITRARSQAAAFVRALEGMGGEVVEFPTIEILPPKSYDLLDRAIRQIENYHWIIFTSVNGVSHFFSRLQYLNLGGHNLNGIKVAAIGPETAHALEAVGVRPDLVPREFQAEAILAELKPGQMVGRRVLLPRAAKARDILPQTLRDWGAAVDVIEAYQTIAAKSDPAYFRLKLMKKEIDMITFTSSSTVAYFAELFPKEDIGRLLPGIAVACIGPITQRTAQEIGIRVDVIARDYTIPGLTQAIVDYFKRQ